MPASPNSSPNPKWGRWKARLLETLRQPGGLRSILAPVAFIAAGAAIAVWIVWWAFHEFYDMRDAVPVSAEVIETYQDERDDDRGRVGFVTVATYEFTVQGSRFKGWTEREFSVGDKIDVEYNPKDPTQNRAKGDRPGRAKLLTLLLIVGGFSYIFINIGVSDFRRLFARNGSLGADEPLK